MKRTILHTDQIDGVESGDRADGRGPDSEQHVRLHGVRRVSGGRRQRRRDAGRQPAGRAGWRQHVRVRVGRPRARGQQRVPRPAGRHAAAEVGGVARRVPGQHGGQRGPGPVPVRRRGRGPRDRQPVRVRLRPAAHQCAQDRSGVSGAVAGRGRPAVAFPGRELLPTAGQHHAGRLPGLVGRGRRM